jgi:diguanylate cyclase (GGDEF)-like protein
MASATDSAPTVLRRSDHGLDETTIAVLSRLKTPVWVFDVQASRILWANQPAIDLWEASSSDELYERDLRSDMSISAIERVSRFCEKFEQTEIRLDEIWTIFPAGLPKTLRCAFSPQRLGDGRMGVLFEAIAFVADNPERVRSTDALIHTPVMITLYDQGGDNRPLYRNTAALASIERLGQAFEERFVDAADHRRLFAMLADFGHAVVTARVATSRGVRWHELSARPCLDSVTGQSALLVSETDVTALKTAEERVRFLAEHDLLTGLPNRTLLQREIARRIGGLGGGRLALLFIDLDRFKTINDSLGHQTGDALLVEAASRLKRAVDVDDFVARLGGDEFLVCVTLGPEGRRDIDIARAILSALEQPIVVGDRDLVVSASIGISRCPDDGDDLDTLMRHADLAMYAAKEQGRNRWTTFHRWMTEAVEAQLNMDSCLRAALDRGELELWYQPRVSVADDRIVGAEALLRWRHPLHGLVMPGIFIPHAEKSDLINRIGDFVLHEAALRQKALTEVGHGDIDLSINMSGRQFRDPRLIDRVLEIIAETGCDPKRMQIEITESVLVGDDPLSTDILKRLAELGFSTAIDDFGTGYSNLAMLQRHPIDVLKIDRSFVSTLSTRPEIAELIIGLCRLLGLGIVAEGVETEEQLDWLTARHCDEYQGYLFSPAVPAEDFVAMLDRQRELLSERADTEHPMPLWNLVPMVEEPGDLDWGVGETATGKVRRLGRPTNGRRARS